MTSAAFEVSVTTENNADHVNKAGHMKKMEIAASDFESLCERFGFYPRESVVVRWLHNGEEVLAQRADIPESSQFEQWWKEFFEPVSRYSPRAAQVFVSSDKELGAAVELIEELQRRLNQQAIATDICTFVSESAVQSLDCTLECAQHLRSQRVNGSQNLAESRVELADAIEYAPEIGISKKIWRSARQQFSPEDAQWRSREVDFVESELISVKDMSEYDVSRLAIACTEVRIRDAVLWSIAMGEIPDRDAAERLSDALPHLRGRWAAPIATMAGICWWTVGNGARANICIERALAADRTYSLATLVRAALVHGLEAKFWLESVQGLTKLQCLNGSRVAEDT